MKYFTGQLSTDTSKFTKHVLFDSSGVKKGTVNISNHCCVKFIDKFFSIIGYNEVYVTKAQE